MFRHSTQLTVRNYGDAHGCHSHDHFQILWTLDGCLELEVEGKGIALAKGHALLLQPGDRHDFEAPSGSRCLVLDTNDRTWESLPSRPERALATSQLAAFLATSIQEKIPAVQDAGPYLLIQTWGAKSQQYQVRRPINWTDLSSWVSERLMQPLVASDLSSRVHLSESQFRARCMEELGISPMQFVRNLRLSKAQQLREAGKSAAEAARNVGYESPSAMTVALRKFQSS